MAFGFKSIADGIGRTKGFVESAINGIVTPMFSGGKRSFEYLVKEGYMKNGVMNRVVSEVAESAAAVPFLVYKGEDKQDNHEILRLLNRPNPMQGRVEFFALFYTIFELAGEVFVLATDATIGGTTTPRTLQILPPGSVEVKPNPRTGLPDAYIYKPKGGNHERFEASPTTGESRVKHFKQINPLNPDKGFSRYNAALYDIKLHNEILRHNIALIQNGARPSGIVSSKSTDKNGNPKKISPEQRKEAEQSIKEGFSGAENTGKVMYSNGDIDFKAMGLTPKEMDYAKSRNASAKDIALVGGVPGQLIGIPDSQTYNNVAEAKLSLYQDKIIPMAERVLSDLNEWLLPRFGLRLGEYRIAYDWAQVPAHGRAEATLHRETS